MKKFVALTLAALLLMALIPGMTATAEEKTVVKVASWDVTGAAANYHEAIKAGFEAAHPDMTIEWVDLASQEYNMLATAMLSGGDTTDVYVIKELSDLQNWTDQGFIEPLDSYVAADSFDLSNYAGMDKQCVTLDGALGGLPFRSDFWVLYYNKTLFDAAGVAYPTNDMTWDQYAELAKQLTVSAGIDSIYGTHYHTWLSAVVNWAVCDGKYTLADGVYDPLKYFYDLYFTLKDAGACMDYSELKAANLHYSAAFYQGNIAMLPMGSWFIGTLIAQKAQGTFDFDWSFVSVPHMDGVAAKSSFGNLTAISMSKASANKEGAWEFIKYACGEEGAKAIAAVGTRPGYASAGVAAAMASTPGFPMDETAIDALQPSMVSLEWPTGQYVNELKTLVNEEHTAIMTEEETVDEGIANMNARAAEVMAN